jgi:hypothetical protein
MKSPPIGGLFIYVTGKFTRQAGNFPLKEVGFSSIFAPPKSREYL